MKATRGESGQAMVLTLLCMTCLFGFVALATDVGTLFHAKRLVQTAADAAAIAGAAELNYGDAAYVTSVSRAAAAQNGVTNGTNGASVSVNTPAPAYGAYAGLTPYVEVIVSQPQPTFFMRAFSLASMTVTARAVAGTGNSQGCIYALGTTGSDITLTGSGSIAVRNCMIIDDSSGNPALTLTGSGDITAKSIGIAGTRFSKTGSGSITPTPTTGIVPVSDPLAWLPAPSFNPSSCQANPNITGSTPTTLSQGCYNGISDSGSGALTLNSGTYIINGAFSITGSLSVTGTGVTLYFPNSGASLQLTGSGTINLTAPTTGTYNGILFYQDRSDTAALSVTGSSTLNLQGIIYAPSANVTVTGSGSSALYTSVVAKTFTLTGSGSINDYASINPSSDLSSATLVE
jgi:Flp pilus assembly protein TadG